MFKLSPCIIVVVFTKKFTLRIRKKNEEKKTGNFTLLYYCFIGGRKKEHGYLHQNGNRYINQI